MHNEGKPIKTGELAKLTGVAVNTLRAYEREGLIRCGRTRMGQRYFAAETVQRVQRIRELRGLKMSLPEIKAVLLDTDLIAPDLRTRRAVIQARLASIARERLKLEAEERELVLHLKMLDRASTSPA